LQVLPPAGISLVAFAVILCGAFAGAALRKALPGHHHGDDAKDVIRLGTGLIATIAALVLGLLIASAKSSYDTQSNEVQHLTADIVLLDQLLSQYGPEARPIAFSCGRPLTPQGACDPGLDRSGADAAGIVRPGGQLDPDAVPGRAGLLGRRSFKLMAFCG
jgi:hypothetical protein